MFRRSVFVFLLWFFASGAAWANKALPWQGGSEFLEASEVLTLGAAGQQGDLIEAQASIADGYYVYRKSLQLQDAQGQAVELALPPGSQHEDDFFGVSEIYLGKTLRLGFAAATPGPAVLHWQGCAKAGICYPPQTLNITLPESADKNAGAATAVIATTAASAATASANTGIELAQDQALAQRLTTLGPISATLLFFGFGLLLAFTPCTLPMIPIVSTMVVGSGAKPRRALLLSLAYVLTMALTYAAVGVAAGLAGANLQASLQSPWLLSAFAALFLLLAASLFGLFELRLPSALVNRLDAAGQQRPGGSLWGAAALGLLSALLVGPCMTAPLAGALLYISQTGSALTGGAALFALGLGMGLPLLAIAVYGARVLPRPGLWMERVKIAFAYVMVGMAVLMLSRFLPASLSLALWAVLGLAMSAGLGGWAYAIGLQRRPGWALAFAAALAGLWSGLMLAGAASGGSSVLQPLAHLRSTATAASPAFSYVPVKSIDDVNDRVEQAAARGQWTLIDFYADWCVSCHVMEREVFGHPEVAQRLASMQVLRPDVTKNDAVDQALLKHWGVLGPPTLILIGPDGKEIRTHRVVGELDASAFIQRLNAAGTP